ncbi:universal stress protein [Calothrix sp. NIES-3974]|uniref:universal stress protein n=1 Tax=Calothrix sp. NIES-3974 TaxID=2005462 RepID=UPI000B5FB468|nr:universal stress protein [Calothrix sp. NIES-3974]BAZ04221.1 putative Na+/H+-exchanging protein [Calothrix sp. NIES-3974]
MGFSGYPVFLAAVDTSPMATDVLTKVADLARRSNGSVIVLHADNYGNENAIAQLKTKIQRLLADIQNLDE